MLGTVKMIKSISWCFYIFLNAEFFLILVFSIYINTEKILNSQLCKSVFGRANTFSVLYQIRRRAMVVTGV